MSGVEAVRISVPAIIDAASAVEFAQAIQRATIDPRTRVVVFAGGDGVFCRGFGASSERDCGPGLAAFAEALLFIRRAPFAVISVVDGMTLGGGVGVVAASDVVIASEDSTFGLPEALLGLTPATILPFLLERMRPQTVRLWALSAYARSAMEAAKEGLVDVVAPAADLNRHTAYWTRQLSRAHPDAVARVKQLTAEAAGLDLETAVRKGSEITAELLKDPMIAKRVLDLK